LRPGKRPTTACVFSTTTFGATDSGGRKRCRGSPITRFVARCPSANPGSTCLEGTARGHRRLRVAGGRRWFPASDLNCKDDEELESHHDRSLGRRDWKS